MSWVSFDLGLYREAAEGFAKADCGAPDKGRYLFLGGMAWMKAGINENARAFFAGLVHRGGDEIEPRTGVELLPLSYAYFVKLAADSGDVDAIDELNRYYGNAFYATKIVWLNEALKPLGTASVDADSRDYRVTDAAATIGEYGLFQKARALYVGGSFDEGRALLETNLGIIKGKHLEDGEVRDLRQSAEELMGGAQRAAVAQVVWGKDNRIWYVVAGIWLFVIVLLVRRSRLRKQGAESQDRD